MGTTDLLQNWRAANFAAMAATRAAARKSMLALDGRGEPPSASETAAARNLHAKADDLLEITLERMRQSVTATIGYRQSAPLARISSRPSAS